MQEKRQVALHQIQMWLHSPFASVPHCLQVQTLYRLDAPVRAGFVEQSDPQQLHCVVGYAPTDLFLQTSI